MEIVKFEDLGLESGPYIPRFRFLKEELKYKKRIFFLPTVYRDVAHTKEGYGYFECLIDKKDKSPSGVCPACQAGVKAVTRYGMYVINYSCNPDGTLKAPLGWEVQAFIKNEVQFKKIGALQHQYQAELFNHDFMVSCENTDYQNLVYNIDLNCIWKSQPNKAEILADVKAKIAQFPLNKILAPEITLETMEKIVTGKIPPRFATKNQQAAQPATQGVTVVAAPAVDSSLTFPPAGSAPYVPPTQSPAPAVASASKSDLDILNELSVK